MATWALGHCFSLGWYCFLRTVRKLEEILWGCYSEEGREYIVGVGWGGMIRDEMSDAWGGPK